MPKCRVCGREAWVRIPWGNTWFCRDHFIEYFERKVWRTFTRYVPRIHKRILFAVSGGKDSMSMLYSLAPRLIREGYKVSALFIDLGISGYSEYARKVVEKAGGELNVELLIHNLKETHGFTVDDVANAVKRKVFNKSVCSLCGGVKRYIYNYVAVKHGFDLVLTGHTLDDIFAFIVSDLVTGSVRELAKLKPYTPSDGLFAAKARPLFFNYEVENSKYVEAKGIEVVTYSCPYKPSEEEGLVKSAKSVLYELEKRHPGVGLLFLKNFLKKLSPLIASSALSSEHYLICSVCGMPAQTDPCSFCKLKARLLNIRYELKGSTG